MLTYGDKIRSMTDEELAKAIIAFERTTGDYELSVYYCDGNNNCIDEDGNILCSDEMRKACVERWLRTKVSAHG